MSYTIEVVDCTDKNVENGIAAIFRDGFGFKSLPADISMFFPVTPPTAGKSIILAAKESGEIIGCNGFIATDFYIGDKVFTCYQSCWSVTHPKHQGRKIFTSILNYAKEYLKEKNGGFIFGVPNNTSHPIFIHKLGFSEIPSMIVRIPNIPVIRDLFFNKKAAHSVSKLSAQSLKLNEEQVINLKKRVSPEAIEVIRVNNSFAWGKIKKLKKLGITFRYFYIGGIQLVDPMDYASIVKKIFSQFHVSYVQIVSCQTNSTNAMLKYWKKTKMNGFIFFDLNAGPFEHVNMQWGVIDVF